MSGIKKGILLSLMFMSSQIIAQGTGDVVKAVFVDEHNSKWFGTDLGLLRFDGTTWTAYNTSLDIPGTVNALANEDTDEGMELWVGTSSGITVASYGIDGFTDASNYNSENSALESNTIVDIVLDSSNTRFFATPEGLGVFENDQWTWLEKGWGPPESGVPNYELLSLGAHNDTIYVGATNRGAGRVINEVDGFSGASYYEQPWTGIAGNTVNSIFTDSNGYQWFGTTEGVSYHTHQNGKKGWDLTLTRNDGLVYDDVNAIFENKEGDFWFATDNGISKFTLETLEFTNFKDDDGLADNRVFDIAEDQDHVIWFATANGVSSFDGNTFTNYATGEHAKEFTNIIAGSTVKKISNASQEELSVYPNPASTHLYIKIRYPGRDQLNADVYNISGKHIRSLYEGIPEENEIVIRWNLNDTRGRRIQTGVYFITISSPGYVITKKTVVF